MISSPRIVCAAATVAAFVLSPTALDAQQTWVVDRAGGPGSHFRTIEAAVAAAAAGDVVLVRSGTYSETALDIDKELHLVGEGTVQLAVGYLFTPGARVHDLPVGAEFSMTNFELTGVVATAQWEFQNCPGLVVLQSVRSSLTSSGRLFEFIDCAQVHGHDLFAPSHPTAVVATRSSLVLTGCAFEGNGGGPLRFQDSQVTIDSSSVTSDRSVFFNNAAIELTGGELRIARSLVHVRENPTGTPVPAVAAVGGNVLLDPTATLTAAGGSPAVSGASSVAIGPLSTLWTATDGSVLSVNVHGPTGASFVSFASFSTRVLPTPLGELWVNTNNHLILDSGVLPASRENQFDLGHVPLPLGFHAVVQVVLYDNAFLLSNAAAF